MNQKLYDAISTIMEIVPESYAFIHGSGSYPEIKGSVYFYPMWDGTLVVAEIEELPQTEVSCQNAILGFHIHAGNRCLPSDSDPFGKTGLHYNPGNCEHPNHAGDMPPLFVNHGKALLIFYTDRFYPDEIVGHTVVVHNMPDDFHSQPSGNAGEKIACGEIKMNKMNPL